jgi:ABC-type bacteriocin/lantibiotic exporter with double-glycine peptidase domain
MGNILKRHLEELKHLTAERKAWLVLSAFIIVVINVLIFDNRHLANNGLLWPIGVGGILLCVVWWYWVMRTIRQLIKHREEETVVLIEIVESVKAIREDVKSLPK